ncbi:MAG: hypothetical protein H0U86_08230 [Chloroflexi bacterium]|nr:hypothetical protein [Chloroflexota bacterium]
MEIGTLRWQVSVIWRWLPFATITIIASAILAYFVSSMLPSEYTSRVTLLVGPPLARQGVTLNDVLVGQALLPTYAHLAITRPFLERAIGRAGVDDTPEALLSQVTTLVPEGQSVLELSVSRDDAAEAAELANAIANELAEYAREQNPDADPPSFTVSVIDPAVAADRADSPRVLFNTALAAGVSLLLVFAIGFLVENLRGEKAP